jgi:phosphate:Na+ symporter
MRNAMAILGANLGTTLDSWVVATLGFNMDIEVVSYPAVCAGRPYFSLEVGKHIDTFPIFFWIWFIVYRLSFMKTAMEAKSFDFSHYATMSLAVYLLIGFMTVVVQSSSVTMALTLSALHVSAISLPYRCHYIGVANRNYH